MLRIDGKISEITIKLMEKKRAMCRGRKRHPLQGLLFLCIRSPTSVSEPRRRFFSSGQRPHILTLRLTHHFLVEIKAFLWHRIYSYVHSGCEEIAQCAFPFCLFYGGLGRAARAYENNGGKMQRAVYTRANRMNEKPFRTKCHSISVFFFTPFTTSSSPPPLALGRMNFHLIRCRFAFSREME